MRCALDLQVTAKLRAEENAKAEILRKQKEKVAMRDRTIAFCEKLGAELEAKAEAGQTPTTEFYFGAYCNKLLMPTRNDYADHRKSYNPTGGELDLELITEWFAQYCFEVNARRTWVWWYGCGQSTAYCVTISPKAQCLQ